MVYCPQRKQQLLLEINKVCAIYLSQYPNLLDSARGQCYLCLSIFDFKNDNRVFSLFFFNIINIDMNVIISFRIFYTFTHTLPMPTVAVQVPKQQRQTDMNP